MEFKGEFIDDEPVGDDAMSTETPVRRFSTSNSTTDGESTESSRADLLPDAKTAKHQRSRSFVEIVGRKIKDPIL
jgi:hypothetical protein